MNFKFLLSLITLLAITFSALAERPKIVSHRGYRPTSSIYENTIASLQKAVELDGVHAVELDLWMTTDGVLYVHHDETYRFEGIEGFTTWTMTSEDVDEKIKNNNLPLPRFTDFLDAAKDLKTADGNLVNLVIEFKSLEVAYNNGNDASMAVYKKYDEDSRNAILYLIENDPNYSSAFKGRITYISFSDVFCQELAKDSTRDVYFLIDGSRCRKYPTMEEQNNFLDEVKSWGVKGIDVNLNLDGTAGALDYNPNLINMAHARGMKVNVWTIDSNDQIKLAIEKGADLITTNNPVGVYQSICDGFEMVNNNKTPTVYTDGEYTLRFYNKEDYPVIAPLVQDYEYSNTYLKNYMLFLVRTGVVKGTTAFVIERSAPEFEITTEGVTPFASVGAVKIYDIETGAHLKTIMPPDGYNVWVSGNLDAGGHLLVQLDKANFGKAAGACSPSPDHGFMIIDTENFEIIKDFLTMGLNGTSNLSNGDDNYNDNHKTPRRYDAMAPVMKDILKDENVRILTPYAYSNLANQNSYNTLQRSGGNPENYPEFFKYAEFKVNEQEDITNTTQAFALEYMPIKGEGSNMAMYHNYAYSETFSAEGKKGNSIRNYTGNWTASNDYFLTPMHSGLTGFNIFTLGEKQFIIYPARDPGGVDNFSNMPADGFAIAEVKFVISPLTDMSDEGEKLKTINSRANTVVGSLGGNMKALFTGGATQGFSYAVPTYTVEDHTDTAKEITVFVPGAPVVKSYFVLPGGATGVEIINSESDNKDYPVEYFNLQGVLVKNPTNGIFIKRQGSRVEKVLLK